MAWRQPGDKPLSVPMMVSILTQICVTRPQWVNSVSSKAVWFHTYNTIYHILGQQFDRVRVPGRTAHMTINWTRHPCTELRRSSIECHEWLSRYLLYLNKCHIATYDFFYLSMHRFYDKIFSSNMIIYTSYDNNKNEQKTKKGIQQFLTFGDPCNSFLSQILRVLTNALFTSLASRILRGAYARTISTYVFFKIYQYALFPMWSLLGHFVNQTECTNLIPSSWNDGCYQMCDWSILCIVLYWTSPRFCYHCCW